jgi:hypothetical protein
MHIKVAIAMEGGEETGGPIHDATSSTVAPTIVAPVRMRGRKISTWQCRANAKPFTPVEDTAFKGPTLHVMGSLRIGAAWRERLVLERLGIATNIYALNMRRSAPSIFQGSHLFKK